MKRILDALAICICLLGISYLYDYKQAVSYSLDKRLGNFESDIMTQSVLKDGYGTNHPSILNVEENKAGRLGRDVSKGLESVTSVVVDVMGELVNFLLK